MDMDENADVTLKAGMALEIGSTLDSLTDVRSHRTAMIADVT